MFRRDPLANHNTLATLACYPTCTWRLQLAKLDATVYADLHLPRQMGSSGCVVSTTILEFQLVSGMQKGGAAARVQLPCEYDASASLQQMVLQHHNGGNGGYVGLGDVLQKLQTQLSSTPTRVTRPLPRRTTQASGYITSPFSQPLLSQSRHQALIKLPSKQF